MCDRSGDNRRMVEEKEQKVMLAIMHDCVGISGYTVVNMVIQFRLKRGKGILSYDRNII